MVSMRDKKNYFSIIIIYPLLSGALAHAVSTLYQKTTETKVMAILSGPFLSLTPVAMRINS